MKIEQIRVYAEVLEQGIDFKEYIENSGKRNYKKNYGSYIIFGAAL